MPTADPLDRLALRSRMIADAVQVNGGDPAGATATVDGYFASAQQGGG